MENIKFKKKNISESKNYEIVNGRIMVHYCDSEELKNTFMLLDDTPGSKPSYHVLFKEYLKRVLKTDAFMVYYIPPTLDDLPSMVQFVFKFENDNDLNLFKLKSPDLYNELLGPILTTKKTLYGD